MGFYVDGTPLPIQIGLTVLFGFIGLFDMAIIGYMSYKGIQWVRRRV